MSSPPPKQQKQGSLPAAHGPPVHFGDPKELGIEDINKVDFGDAVTIKEDEVPVFWACGVTSSLAALSVKPDLAITHSPGCMVPYLLSPIQQATLKNHFSFTSLLRTCRIMHLETRYRCVLLLLIEENKLKFKCVLVF